MSVQRWNDLADVPDDVGPCVVTLGNFDGVHAGHKVVLQRLVARARAERALAVAITFDPHPLQVLHPERAPELITGLGQRLDLLEAVGVDAVVVMSFTRELAGWSPEEFVVRAFVEALHARAVVVGHDTRFGHRNAGDVGTLRELGERHGFAVDVVDELVHEPSDQPSDQSSDEGRSRRWSSSWVRELLAEGRVDVAAGVLGRPHRLTGEVVHGDHRGRELGYPTANLAPESEGMVPADGVYAGWLLRTSLPQDHLDRLLPAAVSIGTNPTFDGVSRRVEAYVLDRTDLDLYGERVGLELVTRLRDTLRFESVDDLVVQMGRDVEDCRAVLSQGLVPTARTHEQPVRPPSGD